MHKKTLLAAVLCVAASLAHASPELLRSAEQGDLAGVQRQLRSGAAVDARDARQDILGLERLSADDRARAGLVQFELQVRRQPQEGQDPGTEFGERDLLGIFPLPAHTNLPRGKGGGTQTSEPGNHFFSVSGTPCASPNAPTPRR